MMWAIYIYLQAAELLLPLLEAAEKFGVGYVLMLVAIYMINKDRIKWQDKYLARMEKAADTMHKAANREEKLEEIKNGIVHITEKLESDKPGRTEL